MLNWVEYEKSFITSGPYYTQNGQNSKVLIAIGLTHVRRSNTQISLCINAYWVFTVRNP